MKIQIGTPNTVGVTPKKFEGLGCELAVEWHLVKRHGIKQPDAHQAVVELMEFGRKRVGKLEMEVVSWA